MTVTGRQLIDYVNAHGQTEVGVCECRHWWEEHHDGTCDACLDNAADQDDPHAVADHEFVFSDAATAESDYLNQRALELGFPFEEDEAVRDASASWPAQDPDLDREDAPTDSWFVERARQEYDDEGSIEVERDHPKVSRGDDGAYVMAWVFVPYPADQP